ncbi:hypothetical protein DL96DRAFT_1826821 [Flagelloscypha sp. PMI_526]|nr:hypothetical protein DL96DRAFT_1826821 [Flagelloscypha sp. PMI_526]
MRFFATLVCALGVSISVVSAAHIHGRNALRMVQGLPPLPPRRTTRTDTARRGLPSGASTSLMLDGDFEDDSSTSWIYEAPATRSSDSALCRDSSHCGLTYTTGRIKYTKTLSPYTNYKVTFYGYFQRDLEYTTVKCNPYVNQMDNGKIFMQWPLEGHTDTSTGYTLQTTQFMTLANGILDLYFGLTCYGGTQGQWFIDDVSVVVYTHDIAPDGK